MRPVTPPCAEFLERAATGHRHHPRRLRRHEGRISERGHQVGLDPLRLGQRRRDPQQRLAGEDDRPLGHRPDVALEPHGRQGVHDRRVDRLERGPSAHRIDLLRRERQPQQVADGLFQSREDHVGAVGRHLPDEQLERRALRGHAGFQVPGHHRELVEVGDRPERVGIGPERNRWFMTHRAAPGRFGRYSRSGAERSASACSAADGSTSSSVGRLSVVGTSRTRSHRPSSLGQTLLEPSALSHHRRVQQRPGPWRPRRQAGGRGSAAGKSVCTSTRTTGRG